MKRFLLLSLSVLCSLIQTFAQCKKPTLMVLPSDNWCNNRYFMMALENQGTIIRIPDYMCAFQQDAELGTVISLIGGLFAEYGYIVKDSEQELKNIDVRQGEDNVIMSSTSNAMLAESPLDILTRKTKADLIIQIGWSVNKERTGNSITFQLDAIDSYTNKRIASETGTGKPSKAIVPRILEDSIRRCMSKFSKKLDDYFDGLAVSGREIVLTLRRWDNWDNDFESEYDGLELTDCIVEWLSLNTVGGNFNLSGATENILQFEQVKIPLENERGLQMDARGFANQLRKYLKNEPFGISSKIITRGLGEAVLILGEK